MKMFWCACARASAVVIVLLLSACGGSGSGDSSATPSPLAGVYGNSLDPVVVDASGRMIGEISLDTPPALGAVYIVFSGTAKADGNTWSSSDAVLGQHIVPFTGPPGNPTLTPTGLEGTFIPGESLTINILSPNLSPRVYTQAYPAYIDPVYKGASLNLIAGSYARESYGTAFTITPAGTITGTSQTGCAIAGSVTASDPAVNVYTISATLTGESCRGTSGKRYEFLAFLVSQPSHQIIGIANLDGTQGVLFGDRQ